MESSCLSCGNPTKYKPPAFTGRFCSNKCQSDHRWITETLPKILLGAVKHSSPSMQRFLSERDGRKCSKCGIVDWQGEHISFDIDHKDGDVKNNAPENLRFLCPNCHRQTPTWGNKKRLHP